MNHMDKNLYFNSLLLNYLFSGASNILMDN